MSWFKGTTVAGVVSALVIGIFPFVAYKHLFYGSVNAKYFFLLTFVFILGLWCAYRIGIGKHIFSFRGRPLLLAMALTLGVSYVAAFTGIFPERSLFSDALRSTGLLYLTYVGALAFILSETLNDRDWSLMRRSIAVSAALFSFFTILGLQGLGLSGKFLTINLDTPGITLGSETFAGVYLLIAFAITFIEFSRSSTRREYFLWSGVLMLQFLSPLLLNIKMLWTALPGVLANPLSLVGLARSSSVTALALISYLLGVLVIRRWGSDRITSYLYGAWGAAWILGLSLLVALLFVPGSPVQKRYIEESSAARIIVWEAGFEAFKERPLLGLGPENFRIALDHHFDNRLYLEENLGEIWFDRAHNLFIDTLVSVGVLGLGMNFLLVLCAVMVAVRASRKELVTSVEGNILAALVIAHILQLQTAFDTVGTYGLLGVVGGYLLWLERQIHPSPFTISVLHQRIVGGILAILIVGLSVPAIFGEYHRQKALYRIFVTPNTKQQEAYIREALGQQSDFETFRLASASLIKGLLSGIANKKIDQEMLEKNMRQLRIYEEFLRTYVAAHPEDYRTRMNFVYLLFIKTTVGGENTLTEAKDIIADSYALSPENPLTYAMAALAELYGGNLKAAQAKIEEGIALNPDIEFTWKVAEHIEKQVAQFPEITVLKLENL